MLNFAVRIWSRTIYCDLIRNGLTIKTYQTATKNDSNNTILICRNIYFCVQFDRSCHQFRRTCCSLYCSCQGWYYEVISYFCFSYILLSLMSLCVCIKLQTDTRKINELESRYFPFLSRFCFILLKIANEVGVAIL